MKFKNILSSDLIKYNANNRGNNTGDCVKRSISLAFDLDYNEVSKGLISIMKKKRLEKWNIIAVFGDYIKELSGGSAKLIQIENPKPLDSFIDENCQEGTYLVMTGTPGSKKCNHIVCVIDGKLYDSWDSRKEEAKKYYVIEGVQRKFTDVSSNMERYSEETSRRCTAECEKLMKKYGWEGSCEVSSSVKNFSVFVQILIVILDSDPSVKNRKYSANYSVVFTPTTTEEEAESKIKETVKVRTYDRFYAINTQEKKLKEAQEIRNSIGGKSNYNESHYLDTREEKFFNSLPGWCQPLVRYLSIWEPGQYHDSYRLTIHPLPKYPRKERIEFEAYDAASLRDMLNRYYTKGEVPYEDYSPTEEY